jgi:para-aminobenzoate synthetase component 1
MRPIIQTVETELSPETLARRIDQQDGPVLLRSGGERSCQSRFSFLAAFPLRTLTAYGAQCEWTNANGSIAAVQFGNPWHLLRSEIARFEMIDETDTPFPMGGCFGYWGYDLKQFVEPRVGRISFNDLNLPDCKVGFYPSLMVWDHQLGRTWIIATGLTRDGNRRETSAREQVERWQALLAERGDEPDVASATASKIEPASTLDRDGFVSAVNKVKKFIRLGHIYQANISRRWSLPMNHGTWELFHRLSTVSPAPFSGYMSWDSGALISSSPEQFLRLSGRQITTRPIKGTRPRSINSDEDARLSYELQSSGKERAELVMITDLLRNDVGRICEFGSVKVPDLLKLERYSHVQHLVSTVEGRLRKDVTHVDALASCFPGGSITGAPKIRAMQIIEELEPVSRGPYTGCMGYIGFNRESQLNILIRTAIVIDGRVHYHAGAGIVADSDPEAEFEETNVKARAFFQAMNRTTVRSPSPSRQSSIPETND